MQARERRLLRCASGAAGILTICYAMPQAGALQLAPACMPLHAQLRRFAYYRAALLFQRLVYIWLCLQYQSKELYAGWKGLSDNLEHLTVQTFSVTSVCTRLSSPRAAACLPLEGHDLSDSC